MSNQKLWGGRFPQPTSKGMDSFNASVSFDYILYPYDIEGSLAHVTMLAQCKIISAQEKEQIVKGLEQIKKEIESGEFKWDVAAEDVHLNIEKRLLEIVGPVGGKLHTARSRNDQVALDLTLYCRDQTKNIIAALLHLQKILFTLAKKNLDVFLPGYTHLQRAQPISLSHIILAYLEMFRRDQQRLEEYLNHLDCLPLGAGALAGTSFPIDRNQVAKLLKFSRVSDNSMDTVSNRDFVIELASHLALIMMHLSRLSEEWILWASQEFNFIRLPQEYCTGSSMMPQKVNPDALELIRGKTGRVYGSLMALLTLMKGTPLTYNKDFQEDKEPLFDAVNTGLACLKILSEIAEKVEFNVKIMAKANQEGFVLATEVADYLASHGVPFREAHHKVGELIQYCLKTNKTFEALSLKEFQEIDQNFNKDIFSILEIANAVDRKNSWGGTSRNQIKKQLSRLEKELA